jgi:putative ABC transport system permease protein
MFKNYIKYAFRRLVKGWGYSAVNVLGLAAGITTCFLILYYVHFESTYDKFIPESKTKFRVVLRISNENAKWEFTQISAPAAVAFKDRFPQVEQTVRFVSESKKQVTYQDRVHQEDQILYSDSAFISFFNIKLLRGIPETALSQPGTLLITRTMCRKYFGDENPVGKRLRIDDMDYEVTGLIPDAPNNSHIPYRFVASFDRFEGDQAFTKSNWTKNNCYTYVKLVKGSDPRAFEEQIQSVANQLESPGWDYQYILQQVSRIHLHSKLGGELKPPGDRTNLLILSIIGSFVFFIACFNFVNLSTARSIKRATEVGIRKVVGATRTQLVQQFTGEAILLILMALIIAIGSTIFVFPTFRNFVGLPLQSRDILKPVYIAFLGGLALIAGLGAGAYPALFMARFSPEQIIRGIMPSGVKSLVVRKALVTLQFAIASLLIICALLVNKQISFMKDQQNFGFETDQRIVLRIGQGAKYAPEVGAGFTNRVNSLKDEFARLPTIEQVSVSTAVPGRGISPMSMRKSEDTWTAKRQINFLGVDDQFLSQYRIGLAAGRGLDKTRPSDATGAALINEAAAEYLGWASADAALDKEIVVGLRPLGEQTRRIIGVVEDFHYLGLQSPVEPLVLLYLDPNWPVGYLTLSVKSGDVRETVRFAEKTWSGLFPEYPFEYFFLDEDFKRLYEKEERLSRMIGTLTFLGIFITGLGLWGLSLLTTEQRVKEIGIRKILGASVPGIIFLMAKDFLKWVLAANIIAWPIGYLVLRGWLQNFAYRTVVTPLVFILSAVFALAIALITVGLQTRRAAQANPVDSLRYE